MQERVERCEESCQVAKAELKVSTDAVASIRDENSKLWMQMKDTETELSRQQQHCQEICHQKSNLEAELECWKGRNEHQQRVNAELMKRKEHSEWEFLQLQTASGHKGRLLGAADSGSIVDDNHSLPWDSFETRKASHPTDS